MSRPPGWRDRAAADLVRRHLRHLLVEPPVLVMEDPLSGELVGRLGEGGSPPSVVAWHRRALGGSAASPWPPAGSDGPFRTAFLRLPRAKDELEMSVHAAAHRLAPDGRLFVYGAKDEGAGSASGRIEPVFGTVRTVGTGGRCRLLEAVRPEEVDGLRPGLDAWRIETAAPHPDVPAEGWVSYPGVFAAGRLDEGTALLLEHVGAEELGLGPDSRVLDFGCGDGVVAGVLAGRAPGLRPVMLDVDTVALAAAAENVSAGRPVPADGIDALGADPPFDAVVSNPPYHRGKAETVEVVKALVRGASARLSRGGTLTMVVQRRLPVDAALGAHFGSVEILGDRGPFRVWRGRGPETGQETPPDAPFPPELRRLADRG